MAAGKECNQAIEHGDAIMLKELDPYLKPGMPPGTDYYLTSVTKSGLFFIKKTFMTLNAISPYTIEKWPYHVSWRSFTIFKDHIDNIYDL